jgi:hypothetical protein
MPVLARLLLKYRDFTHNRVKGQRVLTPDFAIWEERRQELDRHIADEYSLVSFDKSDTGIPRPAVRHDFSFKLLILEN